MKFAYLSGCVLAVALVMSASTPSYARGGGHGGHAAHAHAFPHHAGHAHAFAHHAGFAGHHFAANHTFVHNHAGWNHGLGRGWARGRGWGRGWGLGWGRGSWGSGWRTGYWGTRYAGGWWPGCLAAGIINPSYYAQYLNGVTTIAVPTPVVGTQYDVTNVVQPVAPSSVPVDVVTTPSGQ